MPRHAGQVPIYHDHKPTGRPFNEYYREAGEGGGRRYLDCAGDPQWRFGFGLGYTTFKLDGVKLLRAHADTGLLLGCAVNNAGKRAGAAVVQAYLSDPVAELSQPVRRLVGFATLAGLEAGERRELQLDVAPSALAYCHRDGTRRVDAGRYVVWLGFDSADGAPTEVELGCAGTALY